MIETGKYNELKIIKRTLAGIYLGDATGEEVLLPNKYCPENYEPGEQFRVFVYLDHDEKKIATTLTPKILLHEFAFLKVTDVATVGAFMDWGMEKELFVPFKAQQQRMEKGKRYIVYLETDHKTNRLFATSKIGGIIQNEEITVSEGEKVELMVIKKTDLGYTVIINNKHEGLVFENEIFQRLNTGDSLTGYVKKIREDHKIDISLQPIGYKNFNDANAELIHQKLLENKGFIAITDKSAPEEIYAAFGISKKAFKKSIGALYKERKITLLSNGIKLNENQS